MKRNAVIRIIAWTISLVILVGLLVAGMGWKYYRSGSMKGYSLIDPPETPGSASEGNAKLADSADVYLFRPNEITDIKIDWVSGSIRIRAAEDAQGIEIRESEVSDSRYKMVCSQEGSTLKIGYCESSLRSLLGKNPLNKDLTILVPQDFSLKELEIDSASAELTVQNLSIREVSVDTASSESRFETCTVDTLDVDTASGSVYFEGSLNKLDFDSASAGVEAVLSNVPYEIDMDTGSGSLTLFLPEDAGFTAKLDTLSGDFDSTLDFSVKSGKYVRGNGACDIDVSSMSGGVTIRSK